MNKYLKQLEYNHKSFAPWLRSHVSSMRIASLIMALLIGGGAWAFFTVPRTVNPPVNITIVTVQTALPGASSADIEALITEPLEQEINTVDDIDTLISTSGDGFSAISVQFIDNVAGDRALTDVINAASRVRDLPSDATTPSIKLVNFDDEPIVRYALVGKSGVDTISLERFARSLRNELEDDTMIDRVAVSGLPEEQIQIIAQPDALAVRGIAPDVLVRTVARATGARPIGKVHANSTEFAVTVARQALSVDDIRSLPITSPQGSYLLGDVATVTYRAVADVPRAYVAGAQNNAEAAVMFTVYRAFNSEVAHAAEAAENIVNTRIAQTEGAFVATEFYNVNADMEKQFDDLARNLVITIILVFVALLVFVGARQAIIAALSIPLIYMSAFIVMAATGITINFISLFSLLLALGIIVDVTIVIISAMTMYYRTGKFTPVETGLLVWRDFFGMLSITTLTTMWAFLPLLLSSGIIGEFIKPIPIIVSSMLVASVLIGFVIMVPLMVWMLSRSARKRSQKKHWLWAMRLRKSIALPQWMRDIGDHGIVRLSRIERWYRIVLELIISSKRYRRMTIGVVVAIALASFALVPLGLVKNEFFPKEDMDRVYVHAEWMMGITGDAVTARALPLLADLMQTTGVTQVSMQVGRSLDERSLPQADGYNNILFTLLLDDADKRDNSQTIAATLRMRDLSVQYTGVDITIAEPTSGPPAGADITLKFSGDDFDILNDLAAEVVTKLGSMNGVINIARSGDVMPAKIVFVPDYDKLAMVGLSADAVARQLRTYASGVSIAKNVTFAGIDERSDVVLRYNNSMVSADMLASTSIQAPTGVYVPIATLGRFELQSQQSEIVREDTKRIVSVTASVTAEVNATELNGEILQFVQNDMTLPRGYTYATGGANQENNESVQSIMMAMMLAFALIFCTLVIQLKSYRKAGIVLMVIPLAISGVFIIFALTSTPLSFPALIGILALFGIVINNSIIIVSQINSNRAAGLAQRDAIIDGATSRLEPIILSSITTIIGLLPITLTDPMWRGLGGAIIAGLTFSGLIMLIFIPTVYASIMRSEQK